jgi:AcrR family transcriptional regulator
LDFFGQTKINQEILAQGVKFLLKVWHNFPVPYTASRGPGRPPAAKASETRERILRAAREVFSELGYDAATFQAIAIRADLTRPAINHYFASKRELYQQVVQQTNDAVISSSAQQSQHASSLAGRMQSFLDAALNRSDDRSAAAFLVTSVLDSQRHPELSSDDADSLAVTRAFVSSAVNDAIESGELRGDIDVEATVEMLVAMLWGLGFYGGFVGNRDQLIAVTDQFARLLEASVGQSAGLVGEMSHKTA